MHLTPTEKLRVFLGNSSLIAGLVFCTSGLLALTFLVPAACITDLWFIAQPTTQVAGTVISASPTDYSEGESEDRIWEINYQFRPDGQLRQGHSYSSSQSVQPGSAIQVEYVKDMPSTSRIIGTSTSPFPLWGFIPIVGMLLSGFYLVRQGILYCKQAIAIIADVFVVPAVCEAIKPDRFTNDEGKRGYIARYVYQFSGRTHQYLCEVSASESKTFGKQENLALQRSAPTNAMLVAQLPRLIRNKLQLPVNTIP